MRCANHRNVFKRPYPELVYNYIQSCHHEICMSCVYNAYVWITKVSETRCSFGISFYLVDDVEVIISSFFTHKGG